MWALGQGGPQVYRILEFVVGVFGLSAFPLTMNNRLTHVAMNINNIRYSCWLYQSEYVNNFDKNLAVRSERNITNNYRRSPIIELWVDPPTGCRRCWVRNPVHSPWNLLQLRM